LKEAYKITFTTWVTSLLQSQPVAKLNPPELGLGLIFGTGTTTGLFLKD
jgi:hypothetical protein